MPQVSTDGDLYEKDFYAWTKTQSLVLRALRDQRTNLDLDLPHLIEEIEDLGRGQRDAVRSQLIRIIEHCLKLEYSNASGPRRSWHESIMDARIQIDLKLTETLHQDIDREFERLYRIARSKTAEGLRLHDEPDAADSLPADCPYELEDLLREGWYPRSRHNHVA